MRKANIIFAAAMMLLGVAAGIYAVQYRSTDRHLAIGADFFPILMSIGMFLSGLSILVGALRGKVAPGEERMDPIGVSRLAVFAAGCLVYFVLFKPLGFLLDSVLMVMFCMFQMGCRRWGVMAAYSVIMPAAIFVLFYYFMYVSLPLGILEPILPKY